MSFFALTGNTAPEPATAARQPARSGVVRMGTPRKATRGVKAFCRSEALIEFDYHCDMRETSMAIQIRFADVDKLGHVNNAVYLSYIELARMHYFEEVAGGIEWDRLGVIVARAEIDFLAPVVLGDTLRATTRCSRIGTKSFDLSYSLMRRSGGAESEAARALTVMVCFDYRIMQSAPLPDDWKAWLAG
jgi:acyl-CoA thioester hydrolase